MGAATRNMLAKAALLLFAACAYAHDFKLCGTDNLGITAVDVAPDSPIPGQNLTVTFTAAPKQDIVSGDKLTITVKVFGVALGHVDFDSCSELGITCPVKAGTSSTLKATYLVPKAAPGGVPLTAEFTAKNAAGTQYSCVDVDVTMGKPPSTTPMTLTFLDVTPLDDSTCIHHEEVGSHKCYEACGSGNFVVKGLDVKGACPDEYTETDSTKTVKTCSDGVTNLKYCKAGGLHIVDLTEKVKGVKGTCQHAVEGNKCFEGCAPAKFVMKGLVDTGVCPSSFSVTEKTDVVLSCSDGVTNTKYCTTPLYLVNVTMRTKGQAGMPNKEFWDAIALAPHFRPWKCVHREDSTNHKCYDACARDSSFAVKGLTSAGACPSQYSHIDSSKTVEACSDGVTNLKYCSGGALHKVMLLERTKGQSGQSFLSGATWQKAVSEFNPNAECSKDSDCPSSYCQNGFCHGCFDKCCETDTDCKKKGMGYCQNDSTKMPPYFCHA